MIHFNSEGRASGEADVDFASHEEAKEGMKRDRASMRKSPVVSLWLCSHSYKCTCMFLRTVNKAGIFTRTISDELTFMVKRFMMCCFVMKIVRLLSIY